MKSIRDCKTVEEVIQHEKDFFEKLKRIEKGELKK